MLAEQTVIYAVAFLFCAAIIYVYLRKLKKASQKVEAKIEVARQEGLHEPVSLHPVIDLSTCISSGACVAACPEKDILGIVDGKATLINASSCIGHGACFHACPVEAITLVIGTEKRGVDLPHVSQSYESNIPGIYIAGELGGMGLIKNSVEQGAAAVENLVRKMTHKGGTAYDLIIVGAGPAGISASLTAKKHNLRFLTLEQDTLGGTVYTFPRSKVVMTAPMDLPQYGKVKLFDTSKSELLELWHDALVRNSVQIREKTKVDAIISDGEQFKVQTLHGEEFLAENILLAIGRRGTPRKLEVPGETSEKVAYRLLEPEQIAGKSIVVVGGGDSAIEAALSLAGQNRVTLSYRGEAFNRIKPKNREKIQAAMNAQQLEVRFKSNLVKIEKHQVIMKMEDGHEAVMPNDLVYIFAGGELPTQFLEKAGVRITKRFGYTMKKHR
ncbi:MAG TPA: NAD(P)-binding domain-containing protein [Flavilitoribacter sp.]|nr:NAD(P)-binding domain-containing protein [Flavilitoribacter sp.]